MLPAVQVGTCKARDEPRFWPGARPAQGLRAGRTRWCAQLPASRSGPGEPHGELGQGLAESAPGQAATAHAAAGVDLARTDWNLGVRGWWPRWRFRAAAAGGADVELDGKVVARLTGYGPREWRVKVTPGAHTLKVTDLGPSPHVVLDERIELASGQKVFVQFRAAFRRRWFGALVPAECWMLDERPRSSWFQPARQRGPRRRGELLRLRRDPPEPGV